MGTVVVVLLLAVAIAATVIVYAAYPYRGEDTPGLRFVGRAMRRGVEALPTIDPQEHEDERESTASRR